MRFQLMAIPKLDKDLGEKGEFSGASPVFLTSILSRWTHSLWNYKMGWPQMEGSELDHSMNEPTMKDHQPPPRLSWELLTQAWKATTPRKIQQKADILLLTTGQDNDPWGMRLEIVRKRQIQEVCVLQIPPLKSLHFYIHHWNEVLVLGKDPFTPHTTSPSETRRKRPEIASQMSILLTPVHNWIQ